MNTDSRSAARILALNTGDSSESEDESGDPFSKQQRAFEKENKNSQKKDLVDLCPSWMGQVFQIQYILKIFIKHDGFFERGSGALVNLPLRILATPRLEPSTDPWRVAENWNPYQGTEQPTYVYLANPDEKPEYMTRFIDRNWEKWEANLAPVLEANAEEARSRQNKHKRNKTQCARSTATLGSENFDEEFKLEQSSDTTANQQYATEMPNIGKYNNLADDRQNYATASPAMNMLSQTHDVLPDQHHALQFNPSPQQSHARGNNHNVSMQEFDAQFETGQEQELSFYENFLRGKVTEPVRESFHYTDNLRLTITPRNNNASHVNQFPMPESVEEEEDVDFEKILVNVPAEGGPQIETDQTEPMVEEYFDEGDTGLSIPKMSMQNKIKGEAASGLNNNVTPKSPTPRLIASATKKSSAVKDRQSRPPLPPNRKPFATRTQNEK